jgi:hypothetical protein
MLTVSASTPASSASAKTTSTLTWTPLLASGLNTIVLYATKVRDWWHGAPTNREDKLLATLNNALELQKESLKLQARFLAVWDTPEVSSTNARDHRTFEERELIQQLHDAQSMGDEDAAAILSSKEALASYLVQFS